MINRLSSNDLVEFLISIGMRDYETVTMHYGESDTKNYIDNSSVDVVIKYDDNSFQALKFTAMGLCNYSRRLKSTSRLEMALQEDSIEETLETNHQAIDMNKQLYRKMLASDKKPNSSLPTFKEIALRHFDDKIQDIKKEIQKHNKLLFSAQSEDKTEVHGLSSIITKAEREIQRLTSLKSKLIEMRSFIASEGIIQNGDEFEK